MGQEDHARNVMLDNYIPVFSSPEKAAYAMGCLYQHHKIMQRPYSLAEKPQDLGANTASILAQAKGAMDEYQAKQVLADYGIPICPDGVGVQLGTMPQKPLMSWGIRWPSRSVPQTSSIKRKRGWCILIFRIPRKC